MKLILASVIVLLCFGSKWTPASARDKRYPDWPCRQLKVPELSAAAIWSGPSLENVPRASAESPEVSDLVTRVAARRTPMADAEKQIAAFIQGTQAEKQEKAKALFRALLDTLNAQRAAVMNGLERSYRKQELLADAIRANTIKLREQQDAAERDEAKLQDLSRQIEWDTRIFEDRRKSTSFACEVPVEIEQRLFGLSRAIQKALE